MAQSIIGAKVRLIRDATTRGGVTFHKGVIVRVTDSTAHGLTVSCWKRGHYCSIRNLERDAVEVVEMPPPPPKEKKKPEPTEQED